MAVATQAEDDEEGEEVEQAATGESHEEVKGVETSEEGANISQLP